MERLILEFAAGKKIEPFSMYYLSNELSLCPFSQSQTGVPFMLLRQLFSPKLTHCKLLKSWGLFSIDYNYSVPDTIIMAVLISWFSKFI